MYTCLHPCSCSIYDGSQCTSVFGQAIISSPRSLNTNITVRINDRLINQTINLLTNEQNCRNNLLIVVCLAAYAPCPGFAWCGSNSKDELKIAVASACMCNNPDSCIVNGTHISSFIDNTLPFYYQGSSTTGTVGSNNAMCQDVTVGKTCTIWHTFNCK